MYRGSETKEYGKGQLLRLIQEISFDCVLHYDSNRNPLSIDNSIDCNFDICDYECYNYPYINKAIKPYQYSIPKNKITYQTYNEFYFDNIKAEVFAFIFRKIRKNNYLLIEDIYTHFANKNIAVLKILSELIYTNYQIINYLGFTVNLREHKGIIFLTRDYDNNIDITNYINYKNQRVIDNYKFKYIMENIILTNDTRKVNFFCTNPIKKNYDKFDFLTKILFVEHAFKAMIIHPNSVTDTKALRIFTKVLKYQGSSIHHIDDKYVHDLYIHEHTGSSYNTMKKTIKATGLVRYFNEINDIWDYVMDPELEIYYRNRIDAMEKELKAEIIKNSNIYGSISELEMKFRIHFRDLTTGEFSRGEECVTAISKIDRLVKYFNPVQMEYHISNEFRTMTKERIIQNILKKKRMELYPEKKLRQMSDKELKHLISFLFTDATALCEFLFTYLRDKNLLIAV
jgi:hypothetical protein